MFKETVKTARAEDIKSFKLPKEIMEEVKHYRKTRIPRCSVKTCHKDYIKTKSTKINKKEIASEWKPDCDCSGKKNLRLMIG